MEALSTIFKGETNNLPEDTASQRQTSTTPTRPEAIRQAPRVHSKQTRNNTPGIIIPANVTPTKCSPTSEGEQAPTTEGEYTADWYATPRDKRRTKDREKHTPARQSTRLQQNNSPVVRANRKDRMTTIGESISAPSRKARVTSPIIEEVEAPIITATEQK